jgi:hypothetical protein
VVYVAVLGHLFGPNKERGVYKTTDGGKTGQTLSSSTRNPGFTDLVMDGVDNKTLWAASYQRRRTTWGFQWRRTGLRALEDDRCRKDLGEDSGQWFS